MAMPPVERRRTAFNQGPAQPAGAMSLDDDYTFDVGGYIHVPGVLTSAELAACVAALDKDPAPGAPAQTDADFFAGTCAAGQHTGCWGAPWARLLAHPVLSRYLDELCGEGHRLDVAPALLPTVAPHDRSDSAPVELAGGGGGDVAARRVAYFHSNGFRQAQGVRVVFALADAPSGAGGLCILPCTHRSVVPTPVAVRAGVDRPSAALLRQPALAAGDLLLIASTTLRGLKQWRGVGPQRLFSCEYTAPATFPSGGYIETPQLAPMPSEAGWAAKLTASARAEVGLRTVGRGGALVPTADGRATRLVEEDEVAAMEAERDAATAALLRSTGCDPYELWFWTTFGFLVVEGLMSSDWLSRCNRAVDALRAAEDITNASRAGHDMVHRNNGNAWPAGTSEKLRGFGPSDGTRRVLYGMYDWPAPHGESFRECVANPEVATRLNWMMGYGYHDTQPPQLVNSRPGEGGFSMHGGPYTNPLPSFHSVGPFDGRCHTEQVNLGWQLDATAADDGGFQVLLGSHVGNYPLPWEDKNSMDHPLVVPTPAPAGSVVFFMGGAVLHGVRDETPYPQLYHHSDHIRS
jgi:hypothetical protein